MVTGWESSLKQKQTNLTNGKEESIKKQVEPSLVVNNITAKWNSVSEINYLAVMSYILHQFIQDMIEPTLKNITARLKPGELLCVIGPVGSSKVSFAINQKH